MENEPTNETQPDQPPVAAAQSQDLQAQLDQKLLRRYADARRDQHEVINKLLETLSQVDNLPEDQIEQVRDAVFHTDYPFLLVLVGPFSAGKSSIINALLGENVLDVGPVPTTDHIHILRYGPQKQISRVGETTTIFHPHPLLENMSFVDTPGLESVFEAHDKITRSFLHRSDLVLLVMVATHVLSTSNLDFLQELRVYGKRTIVVVNQIDVLDEADRATVRDFVAEQSKMHFGVEPIIWMVSAKQALEAQAETPRDEILYDNSGFAEIEEYIVNTLNDSVRIKQKLETSLQIANNVREKADTLVGANQSALTQHQKTLKNMQAQIEEASRAQKRTSDEGVNDIDSLWLEAIQHGESAIGELFQFSRAFGQIFAGIGELTGLASLIRRFGKRTRAESAFERHEVLPTLNKIPAAVDKLGARLEGRDLQDIDDLVQYTRTQIEALPTNLKDKVIGSVQSPMSYDRSFLRQVRGEMDDILADAGRFETASLDRQLKNMLVVLAVWELIVVAITLAVGLTAVSGMKPGTLFVVFGMAILIALVGMALLPLRGWLLKRAYTRRMDNLRERYLRVLNEALGKIVAYGGQIRRDTVAPFTRLVDSQTRLTDELKTELDTAEQAIQRIQRGIATF